MTPKIYCMDYSPPVRSVYLTAAAIGLDIEKKQLDMWAAGEHLTPEYLKLNPQHTVPTLEDGDFVIWDSHAINTYLIGTYSKNDFLYPKNLQQRAIVDQRLYFDSGVLFPRLFAITYPIWTQGVKTIPKEKSAAVYDAYTTLETLLSRSKYIALDEMTVADLVAVATVTSLNVLVPIAENRYPRICAWIEDMKQLPYYSANNEPGLNIFDSMLKAKMN